MYLGNEKKKRQYLGGKVPDDIVLVAAPHRPQPQHLALVLEQKLNASTCVAHHPWLSLLPDFLVTSQDSSLISLLLLVAVLPARQPLLSSVVTVRVQRRLGFGAPLLLFSDEQIVECKTHLNLVPSKIG